MSVKHKFNIFEKKMYDILWILVDFCGNFPWTKKKLIRIRNTTSFNDCLEGSKMKFRQKWETNVLSGERKKMLELNQSFTPELEVMLSKIVEFYSLIEIKVYTGEARSKHQDIFIYVNQVVQSCFIFLLVSIQFNQKKTDR